MKGDLSFFATISGAFAVVALVIAPLIGEDLPGTSIFAENATLAMVHLERLTSTILPAGPVTLVVVKSSSPPITSVAF
jgi:hypothetical protein